MNNKPIAAPNPPPLFTRPRPAPRHEDRVVYAIGSKVIVTASSEGQRLVEMMDEKGHVAYRYFLYDCWVSEYTAMPELNANANAISIESMKLELEGWDRDQDTKEPNEADDVPKD